MEEKAGSYFEEAIILNGETAHTVTPRTLSSIVLNTEGAPASTNIDSCGFVKCYADAVLGKDEIDILFVKHFQSLVYSIPSFFALPR